MKNFLVEQKFAWLPVLIRDREPWYGFNNKRWVWLRKYTRVWKWDYNDCRYRTYDTFLGHVRELEK